MKKIVVININKDYCFGCTQTTCSGTLYDFLSCCVEDKEYKKEQVPETFEELKELCKGMYADITEHSITLFGCLKFWDDGKLSFFHYSDIVNNLKPAQMWQIIKSLIGEE